MPLKDHAKFGTADPWSSVHATWAIEIMARLNKVILTRRFKARPNLHLGVRAEVDIGTLERSDAASLFECTNGSHPGNDRGGVATAVPTYAPPAPPLTAAVEFGDATEFEVRVLGDLDGWNLVAAVELVSPANKDRDEHRTTFASKCATYLAAGVSVVVVDVVTSRLADLHHDLCELLDLPAKLRWRTPSGLSAVCYHTVQGTKKPGEATGDGRVRLDIWPHALTIGSELPTVPLWLAADIAVPLELELTYAAACDSLRLD